MWSGRFKSGLWAQRVRIGTRSWDVNMRVLHCNTIRMRLVGALATTFLFRGKSKQKRVFEERRKCQGLWAEWCRKGGKCKRSMENKPEKSVGHWQLNSGSVAAVECRQH